MLRKLLSRTASTKALRLRSAHSIAPNAPVNAFDLSIKIGIDVRFIDIPSLEGMYMPNDGPRILLTSLRPPARQHFTCAHELGHHELQHGQKIDQLVDSKSLDELNSPDEIQADTFASSLLMPKAAVSYAFLSRGWNPSTPTPEQIYRVANALGVGYTTLIAHMSRQLGYLSRSQSLELERFDLKRVRSSILGAKWSGGLHVVDANWQSAYVDCEIGDLILFPASAKINPGAVGVYVMESNSDRTTAQATEKGEWPVTSDFWHLTVRVSQKGFIGRYVYKFEREEAEI